jgi:hypothetical protein
MVRQLLSEPKQNPSKHQAQRRHLFVFFIVFKVLMVSSFLLGMVLFCPSERVHPGGLQEKD